MGHPKVLCFGNGLSLGSITRQKVAVINIKKLKFPHQEITFSPALPIIAFDVDCLLGAIHKLRGHILGIKF